MGIYVGGVMELDYMSHIVKISTELVFVEQLKKLKLTPYHCFLIDLDHSGKAVIG